VNLYTSPPPPHTSLDNITKNIYSQVAKFGGATEFNGIVVVRKLTNTLRNYQSLGTTHDCDQYFVAYGTLLFGNFIESIFD
jgi:hypothetical protein